ncbi:Kinetochore protein NUF2 homolog [Linum perenne]
MSKFEYPRLSSSDIVSILQESQIAVVTDQDLANPSRDFVTDIYFRLLIHLDILSEDDHGQMEFTALEHLENPDHHVDSLRIMNLYVRLREAMNLVHCPLELNLKDLVKPQSDRTVFFISSILNFCLHKETKISLLSPIVEELTLLDEQRKELETTISELNEEIEEYSAARETELPYVQEVEAEVKELHQTIANLNSQQMSLRTDFKKLKEKAGEMDGELLEGFDVEFLMVTDQSSFWFLYQISKAEFDLVQSLQENATLRSKIVQSPDKLQKALEEKRSIREEASNAEKLALQTFQQKTSTLEVYGKTCKKLSKIYSQMQAIHEQMNSAKSYEKDLKALKAKLSDDGMLNKSLDAKIAEREAKAQQLAELRKQLEKERETKLEDANKELRSKQQEVESKKRDLEARQRKVVAVLGEADTIKSKASMIHENGAAKVQALAEKCEELVEQFDQYKSSIGDLIASHYESLVPEHQMQMTP